MSIAGTLTTRSVTRASRHDVLPSEIQRDNRHGRALAVCPDGDGGGDDDRLL